MTRTPADLPGRGPPERVTPRGARGRRAHPGTARRPARDNGGVSTSEPARLDGHLMGRVPRAVRERQLLDIAEKLFTLHGYEGTSIEDVARAAGVTRPVVYEHHGDKDGLYIAKPEFFADLAYYRELGLDIVSGGGSEDYWEQLSWEQAGKYPADLILTDTRTYALPRAQLTQFPTWNQLPAVKAGQLGDWSAEPRFNHLLATPVIQQLTALVKGARTDITA